LRIDPKLAVCYQCLLVRSDRSIAMVDLPFDLDQISGAIGERCSFRIPRLDLLGIALSWQ
jgi:hypothetical protein